MVKWSSGFGLWGVRAKWSGELPMNVDPKVTLLPPTKELTVGGIHHQVQGCLTM